ncbi:hypothetical protein Pint_26744 [Pistacia integerrima]|uniref:Uncharacterized protein n=1 Tax=Pistacia integerrima TaxID=434235 RepID=A0ACC0YQ31_9ROSI|nr:hypothetical protein Pint_26744 [Pistacia integerrima]
MDEKKPYEILDSWSPHSEIYKPPIRRDYSTYIGCKVLAHHEHRKRMDWARLSPNSEVRLFSKKRRLA